MVPDDGTGTEEEAPADEDGEGARARPHPHPHPHIAHHFGQPTTTFRMAMEDPEDRDRTGPDERERENPEPRELITVRRHHIEESFTEMRAQKTRIIKKTATAIDAGATCVNCEGRFRATKMHVGGKLCANCFKIHESIKRTVEMCDGTFQMRVIRPGKVHMKLKCAQGHEWTIGMQSRKAKNWCRVCKDEMREETHRMHFEHLQQMWRTQGREQDQLFNDERQHAPPDDPHQHPVANDAEMQEMEDVLVDQII